MATDPARDDAAPFNPDSVPTAPTDASADPNANPTTSPATDAAATEPTPPADPTSLPTQPAGTPIAELSLAAVGGNTTIGLEWPRIADATSYNLYWSSTTGVTPQTGQVLTNVERGYVHRGLDNGTTYHYVVTAITPSGESAPSPEASATPSGEWVLEQLGTGDFDDVLTGQPVPTVPIAQRFHVLLFAEGYTAGDLDQFHTVADHDGARNTDVDRWIDEVFGIEPYSLFREAFVVWYLARPSETSALDPSPNTAFQVPVSGGGVGNVTGSPDLAARLWDALALHPYPPSDFMGGVLGGGVRNFAAAFLIFDPGVGRASVSGLTTSIGNPDSGQQRINAAFGVGHAHEFTHAFAGLRDEYLENDLAAPNTQATGNVANTNQCSTLPWAHLFAGGQINPDVEGLVGAFGRDGLGYHSELLCLMNGTHDNGEYYGDDTGGSCRTTSCTLRPSRLCNFCREVASFRVFERTGLLAEGGFDEWQSSYRNVFYERFEFQVPGVHYDGLLPQSNNTGNSANGTQIFEACTP